MRSSALLLFVPILLVACGRGKDPDVLPPVRGVVVYLVDTLRADHLGIYGYERDTSPAIDAFAREGLVVERCLSQSTWTKPSTASVLTGLYPAQHGANKESASMPAEVQTLAERLASSGVRTAGFYANNWLNEKHGLGQGFQTYEFVDRNEAQRTREVVDRGLGFLDSVGDERFFLYLHVVDPHAPYEPPAPFDTKFTSGYEGLVTGSYGLGNKEQRPSSLNDADWQHLIDLYDGEIAYTDTEFGRFLEGLEERGLSDETLVVFTADHGEEFREHGGWRHNAHMFDEVVRVPLLLRRPGATAGRRDSQLGQQVDITPTVLGALGEPPATGLPGRDLFAPASAESVPFGLTEVDSGGTYRKGVIGANRKYIRAWAPKPLELLFDLENDPGETINLLESSEDLADAHRLFLERFLSDTNQGFFLLFQNGGDSLIKAEFLLFSDVDYPRITSLYTEDMAGKGALMDGRPETGDIEWDGKQRKGTRLLMKVEPGDGDGIRFVPAEGDQSLLVVVRVDGEPIASELLHLGADGAPSDSMPFLLDDGASAALAAPMFPAQEPLETLPYRVRLWSSASSGNDELEFSEEELRNFRALGYFGEE